MSEQITGVLVMSYGTPESIEGIEPYYTHIRRGRPPEKEQLDELVMRYEAIVGGVFPLRQNTDRQVEDLQGMLNSMYPERTFRCYQGLKHAYPFIEDGVKQMAEDGIKEAIGIVLAPHYSTMSVGSYIKRAKETAEEAGTPITFIESYHLHPSLIEALSQRVRSALKKFEGAQIDDVRVLFTAHSLPERILSVGDPYPEQLKETAAAIAKETGVTNWQMGWQSAGRTAEPWLGPDVLDITKDLAEQGVKYVLVCPIGFVSDHLEVLYDLDIEAKAFAAELGMQLERTASLNTDPLYMKTLAESIGSLLAAEHA